MSVTARPTAYVVVHQHRCNMRCQNFLPACQNRSALLPMLQSCPSTLRGQARSTLTRDCLLLRSLNRPRVSLPSLCTVLRCIYVKLLQIGGTVTFVRPRAQFGKSRAKIRRSRFEVPRSRPPDRGHIGGHKGLSAI